MFEKSLLILVDTHLWCSEIMLFWNNVILKKHIKNSLSPTMSFSKSAQDVVSKCSLKWYSHTHLLLKENSMIPHIFRKQKYSQVLLPERLLQVVLKKHLKSIVSSISASQNDLCLKCSSQLAYYHYIPFSTQIKRTFLSNASQQNVLRSSSSKCSQRVWSLLAMNFLM